MTPLEEENPVEAVHEHMHHQAQHSADRWVMGVALSSAVLAAVAAVASLLSGHSVNHAMMAQIRSSDSWNFYQAKSIKNTVIQSQIQLTQTMGKQPDAALAGKIEENKLEQAKIESEARLEAAEAVHAFELHEAFARAVTLFQVAIAIGAVSVLAKKKRFWFVSLGFGVLGLVFFGQALMTRAAGLRHGGTPAQETQASAHGTASH